MGTLNIGDIVARKSYGMDILFKVCDIKKVAGETVVTLKGLCYRIEADAPAGDLIVQSYQKINEHNMAMSRMVDKKIKNTVINYSKIQPKKSLFRGTSNDKNEKFYVSGKILHIDGDDDYLDTCLSQYKKLELNTIGIHVDEKDQPGAVYKLLKEHKPDILVLTGHDGMIKGDRNYLKLDNYRNSKYYIDAVKEARRYERNIDDLIIFAGACQSMYKGIIDAGANFASAPQRVLIHALDPVFICQKVALTSVKKVLDPTDVISSTITGADGIGGLQTRGKYRDGYPSEPYKS